MTKTQERDLHRWVKGLHGMNLEPLEVTMNLNVPGERGEAPQTVPVLLPHEIIDAVWHAGALQFGRSMTGGFGDVAMAQFWDHCSQQEEWKDHPCLKDPSILRSRLLPICLHVDGAEFYTNSEVMVWSLQSLFSNGHV